MEKTKHTHDAPTETMTFPCRELNGATYVFIPRNRWSILGKDPTHLVLVFRDSEPEGVIPF